MWQIEHTTCITWRELLFCLLLFFSIQACLCVLTNTHTYLRYILTGQTPLTVSILLPPVIYRHYESVTERETKTVRQTDAHTLSISLHPPLCPSLVIKTCQEIIGSTEKGQILFSQFKFFWAHGTDYSKLINRHVMNKNTLIMKRGCPMPPFRLVISMRTHVVNSWSVGTSSLRQPQIPTLD